MSGTELDIKEPQGNTHLVPASEELSCGLTRVIVRLVFGWGHKLLVGGTSTSGEAVHS